MFKIDDQVRIKMGFRTENGSPCIGRIKSRAQHGCFTVEVFHVDRPDNNIIETFAASALRLIKPYDFKRIEATIAKGKPDPVRYGPDGEPIDEPVITSPSPSPPGFETEPDVILDPVSQAELDESLGFSELHQEPEVEVPADGASDKEIEDYFDNYKGPPMSKDQVDRILSKAGFKPELDEDELPEVDTVLEIRMQSDIDPADLRSDPEDEGEDPRRDGWVDDSGRP